MIHVFLGWFEQFRVRVSSMAAGAREERREERETLQKMKGNRVVAFYIRRWTGWVLTRSSAPRCGPLDLDPNGSGSIQRLWGVLEIRIHQPRGFGPGSFGPFCFLFSFWIFLLCLPLLLLFGPPVCFNFFPKISKNYYVLLICFWLFCDISTCLRLMKIICVNSSFDLYVLCVFVWIFLWFLIQNLSRDVDVWHLILWWVYFWFCSNSFNCVSWSLFTILQYFQLC